MLNQMTLCAWMQAEYEAFVLEAHSEMGAEKSSDAARESALQHLKVKVMHVFVPSTLESPFILPFNPKVPSILFFA